MQKVLFRIIVPIVLGVIVIIAALFFATGGLRSDDPQPLKISIVSTMYPLSYFAENLLPDGAITTIVRPGVEPHDFAPTFQDVLAMRDADVFMMNGGVDEWAREIVTEREKEGKVSIVAQDIAMGADADDPHVWLDPIFAMDIVRQIGRVLTAAFPNDREAIEAGVVEKTIILEGIDAAYVTGLASCSVREIVTAHDAFGYVASRYNFTAHSIAGISPDEEPSPATLVAMTELIRSRGITTVFFEELVSDALAQTLATETGAAVDVLNPIESAPSIDRTDAYPGIMMENLEKLRTAMLCQ